MCMGLMKENVFVSDYNSILLSITHVCDYSSVALSFPVSPHHTHTTLYCLTKTKAMRMWTNEYRTMVYVYGVAI